MPTAIHSSPGSPGSLANSELPIFRWCITHCTLRRVGSQRCKSKRGHWTHHPCSTPVLESMWLITARSLCLCASSASSWVILFVALIDSTSGPAFASNTTLTTSEERRRPRTTFSELSDILCVTEQVVYPAPDRQCCQSRRCSQKSESCESFAGKSSSGAGVDTSARLRAPTLPHFPSSTRGHYLIWVLLPGRISDWYHWRQEAPRQVHGGCRSIFLPAPTTASEQHYQR